MLPAAVVLGLWLYWAERQGGYFPSAWYPSAIVAVAVLAVTAFATGRLIPGRREVRIPLFLFAGLVVWSFAATTWSASPGTAWDAANKLLLYLCCAWILALLPWTARRVDLFLGAWVVGLSAIACVSLVGAVNASDFSAYLFELRYQDPVGYANGNAALFMSAAFPALMLASRRGASIASSGLFLALATLLVDFALLSQSRGSFVGGAVGLAAFLALAPDRPQALARLLAMVVAVGIAMASILDVYEIGNAGGSLGQALDAAAARIALSVLAAAALGALVAVGEIGLRRRLKLQRAARRLALVVGVALLFAGVVVLAGSAGSVASHLRDEVSTITSDDYSSPERNRATNLDPYERPDYWRVSLDLFAESPIVGAGTGSFEHEYTARRESPKHSRFAHNVYLRVLGEEGLVGGLLLVGFLGAVIALAVIVRRRSAGAPAWPLAATVAVTAYVFTHASFDWLEELPAVASPALALPLVALSVGAGRGNADSPRVGRWGSILASLAFVAALVSLIPPWLSLRYVDRAEAVASSDVSAAFSDLHRAHSLNPHSLKPLLTEAQIAIGVGEDARARRALRDAVSVEDNWYAHFQLALLAAERGRDGVAMRQIALARALSATDPVLARFGRLIAAGRMIDVAAVNKELANQSSARFARSPR